MTIEKNNTASTRNIGNIGDINNVEKLQNMIKDKLKKNSQKGFTDLEMESICNSYAKLKEKVKKNEINHMRIDIIRSLIDDMFKILDVYYKDKSFKDKSFISLYDKILDITKILCDKKFRDEVLETYIEKSTKKGESDSNAHRYFLDSYIKLRNLVEKHGVLIFSSTKPSTNKKIVYNLIKSYIDIVHEYIDKRNKIKSDNETVVEKLSNIKSNADINIISELFEYMMCEFINNSNVFNKECTATITSLFDDLFNGVDCILEFNTKFNNRTFNGISFDVTIASNSDVLLKKFNNIRLYIIAGLLPCVKYYISPNNLEKIKLENIPKIVFNISNKSTFLNILDSIDSLTLFEPNKNINYEFNFLHQIYLQLIEFRKYICNLSTYVQDELNKQEKIYLDESIIQNINKLLDYLKENNQNEIFNNIQNIVLKLLNGDVLNNVQMYLKQFLHIIYKIKNNNKLSDIHSICDLLILDIKKIISLKSSFVHPLKKICSEKDLQEIHKIYKEYCSLNSITDTNFKYIYDAEYYKERYRNIADVYQKSIDTFIYIIIKKINAVVTKKNKNLNELKILYCVLDVLHNDNFKEIKNSNILFDMSIIETFGVYDKYREKLEMFVLEFLNKLMQVDLYTDVSSIENIKNILSSFTTKN